jgi:hypothetical protein
VYGPSSLDVLNVAPPGPDNGGSNKNKLQRLPTIRNVCWEHCIDATTSGSMASRLMSHGRPSVQRAVHGYSNADTSSHATDGHGS